MRPRKRVLLFCADEERASILRYRMETRHQVQVTVAASEEELAAVLLFDLPWNAMVHIIASDSQSAAALMEASAGEATVRVEVWPERWPELRDSSWSTAHRLIWTDDIGAVCPVVVEAMRRKRGPKSPVMCPWAPPVNREEVAA